MAGQGPEIACGCDELRAATDFRGCHRTAAQPRITRQEVSHNGLAFLRLERAGAVDQQPARFHHFDSLSEQRSLQGCELCNAAIPTFPGSSARECRDGGAWFQSMSMERRVTR